ncbi:MAG: glycoside hydrolase family 3 C-terminal domain-containing protein [Alphaproteobacteria bacterium]|nr:glycoside hydrolase family 3 C-terminal domain-containing protein [Alphaproteobacteria bacterium]MBU1524781.1 glycoside hydrolase family 3 C-terminal domain-containing protein [Alphaproteobacteria bacterium]MBU2349919.1 glycoside hydrolase family 3 C-terminal domain-containing protein [Alphaproteobacteria bacterium]MBU2383662.1 glycoside hydrolase family 3 C-terminal domain-containing protein [Alphaproteobacteria bacterium]
MLPSMPTAAPIRSEAPQSGLAADLPRGAQAGTPEGIEALIAAMTLEEKAGQLSIMPAALAPSLANAANPEAITGTVAQQEQAVRAGLLGAVFNGDSADWHRRMQRVAVHESRLGIPLLFAADVIHGFRTIFPVPLAEAAAFDPDLARRTARAAAQEATAVGLAWNFAPMVDVSRDARWGRGVEGAGEDVLLGCALATARVEGFQGAGLGDPAAMLATPKHLAAYGAATAGLDYAAADVSERTLREVYFPPFQAAFAAGALSTMAAFNDVAGVPCHANAWLMQDVLRGEWGFDGFVVSDYTGDFELIAHGLAEDERDAARLAFNGGVDMSMSSGLYARFLPELVRAGEVDEAAVDASVRRVLRLKAALGLFADPFNRLDPARDEKDHAPTHRALAREAARKSVVLLKNVDRLLPLSRDARIALIGPFAAGQDHLNGPWVLFGDPGQAVSVEDGLRAALADPQALTVVEGCGAETQIAGGVDEAVAAARAADVVVLVVGEGERMSGEAQSRLDVGLPEPQRALIEAVRAVGKPTVLILKCGRALTLDPASDASEAILVSWFLGVETGTALADVLFGDHAPSGRLPISFPRHVGQSPFHYDRKPTGRPPLTLEHGEEFKARWRESLNVAAWPFGHGLTYGDVAYSDLDVGSGRLGWDGAIQIAATVTNRGSRAADELVQLYVHDRAASVSRPVRQLKGYRRVTLAPGASERVAFTLTRADLTFVGRDLGWIAEPGRFTVWIAPSAETGVAGEFELLKP